MSQTEKYRDEFAEALGIIANQVVLNDVYHAYGVIDNRYSVSSVWSEGLFPDPVRRRFLVTVIDLDTVSEVFQVSGLTQSPSTVAKTISAFVREA